MVYWEPTKEEIIISLKIERSHLLRKMKNCIGDLERWEIKKELEKVQKELDNLLNQ